jgi:hypothetical protein
VSRFFGIGVNLVFGWSNCLGGRCSAAQEALALAKAPLAAAAAVTGAGALGAVATETAPTVAASALMTMSPDATVGIATSLEVPGAEALDQVMLLHDAEEGMAESLAELDRALGSAPPP